MNFRPISHFTSSCSFILAVSLLCNSPLFAMGKELKSEAKKKLRTPSLNLNKKTNSFAPISAPFLKKKAQSLSPQYAPTHIVQAKKPLSQKKQSHLAKSSNSKPNLKIKKIITGKNSLPRMIDAELNQSSMAKLSKSTALTKGSELEKAQIFLNELSPYLHTQNPEKTFKKVRNSLSENTGWISFSQVYKNIPIRGSEVRVHFKDGAPFRFNGRYQSLKKAPNTLPKITKDQAIKTAQADLSVQKVDPEHLRLLGHTGPKASLVLDAINGDPLLVWEVKIMPHPLHHWSYLIDAQTGKIIRRYPHVCAVAKTASATDLWGKTQTFGVYTEGSKTYLIDASQTMFKSSSKIPDDVKGGIVTMEYGTISSDYITSNSNSWTDKTAVSAHYNAISTYNYFLDVHKRNSIDGSGGTIYSFVHVEDLWDFGPMDNAYWNGYGMYYGDGASLFEPLAKGLDVGAHEMTHGVVEHTANLEYYGESGALNESFADVFGAMVDRDDWQMGDGLIKDKSSFPTGTLRDLKDPHNGGSSYSDPSWQPKHMDEFVKTSSDNGGVHINSGIPNHVFYLSCQEIGAEKAEKIWYQALTTYLTRSSDFADFRTAIEQSTDDLYGSGTELAAIQSVLDDRGLPGGGKLQPTESGLSTHSGDAWLVFADDEDNVFYQTDAAFETAYDLTANEPYSKLSVTDDGSAGLYVRNGDGFIMGIDFSQDPPEEMVISEEEWDNVAISKDGKLMAAISPSIDTAIHVYSFEKEEWKVFKLYNPTFTEGVQSGNVLYADAISFDLSGKYILYDSFNKIGMQTGYSDMDYWDVNMIDVWDFTNNTFSSGNIMKIFPALPKGVSMGNPVYAKDKPWIMAFDRYDANSNEFGVYTYNLETGDRSLIAENNTYGYPDFSKGDERIAFQTDIGSEVFELRDIGLTSSTMAASGDIETITNWPSRFPTWRVEGERDLPEKNLPQISNGALNQIKVLSTSKQLNLQLQFSNSGPWNLGIYNLKGELLAQQKGRASRGSIWNSSIEFSHKGLVLIRLVQGSNVQSVTASFY